MFGNNYLSASRSQKAPSSHLSNSASLCSYVWPQIIRPDAPWWSPTASYPQTQVHMGAHASTYTRLPLLSRVSAGTPTCQKPGSNLQPEGTTLHSLRMPCSHVLLDLLWTYYFLFGLVSFLSPGKILFIPQNPVQWSFLQTFSCPLTALHIFLLLHSSHYTFEHTCLSSSLSYELFVSLMLGTLPGS